MNALVKREEESIFVVVSPQKHFSFGRRLSKTLTFEEERIPQRMPGLTPASEQSFDFDDHAYAAAPGSHGGSVDGENAFVPPR